MDEVGREAGGEATNISVPFPLKKKEKIDVSFIFL